MKGLVERVPVLGTLLFLSVLTFAVSYSESPASAAGGGCAGGLFRSGGVLGVRGRIEARRERRSARQAGYAASCSGASYVEATCSGVTYSRRVEESKELPAQAPVPSVGYGYTVPIRKAYYAPTVSPTYRYNSGSDCENGQCPPRRFRTSTAPATTPPKGTTEVTPDDFFTGIRKEDELFVMFSVGGR